MITDRHRTIGLFSSPSSAREGAFGNAGRRGWAVLAAGLAALLLLSATAAAQPTISRTSNMNASPGILVSVAVDEEFDNAGTNPRFTGVVFSTLAYYNETNTGISAAYSNQRLFVQAKTGDELNALSSPPESPFTVTATVTMTNDEGQTASGDITFETTYVRDSTPVTPTPTTTPTISPNFEQNAPPGTLVSVFVGEPVSGSVFKNPGTNPRFTSVTFSTTEYYSTHQISDDGVRIWVQAKTTAQLNALASPPPDPFKVTADVTMTNDEGQTATGTITFKTAYVRNPTPATPTPTTTPTISPNKEMNAPPGTLVSVFVGEPVSGSVFDNPGTNPRFTSVTFSTTEYYSTHQISDDGVRIWVQAKTTAQLNALASPPPDIFKVTATVTMTNDEGQTATGTITFKTGYARNPITTTPTISSDAGFSAPPGVLVSIEASSHFDDAGTNPQITSAVYSNPEYLDGSSTRISQGRAYLQVKTAAQLNALASPPPESFSFTVELTMTNDEGQTATGTATMTSAYTRTPDPVTPSPTFSSAAARELSPGATVSISAAEAFDDAGTGAAFTAAEFSTTAYYSTHEIQDGSLVVQAKTAAELNALESPPDSPFTVTADVTMTNDAGQTATGTLTFSTSYEKDSTPATPVVQPTLSQTTALNAPPGTAVTVSAADVFDNAGTNPRFNKVTRPSGTSSRYSRATISNDGFLYVQARTAAELNALASPPDSPFTLALEMRMINDEGQTATGTVTFTTSYDRTSSDSGEDSD